MTNFHIAAYYPERMPPGVPGGVIQGIKVRSGLHTGGRQAHRVLLQPQQDADSFAATITYQGQSRSYEPVSSLAALADAVRASDLYSVLTVTLASNGVVLEARQSGAAHVFTVSDLTGLTATVTQQGSDGDPLPSGVVVSYAGDDRTFARGGASPAGVVAGSLVVSVTDRPEIPPGRYIDVVQQGEVWGLLAEGAAPSEGQVARYLTASGLLTVATGAGTAALPNSVFRGAPVEFAPGARIVRVAVNLP